MDADAGCDFDADADPVSNIYPNRPALTLSHVDAHAVPHPYRDADVIAIPHDYAHPDRVSHVHADVDADIYAGCHAHINTDLDIYSHAYPHTHAGRRFLTLLTAPNLTCLFLSLFSLLVICW